MSAFNDLIDSLLQGVWTNETRLALSKALNPENDSPDAGYAQTKLKLFLQLCYAQVHQEQTGLPSITEQGHAQYFWEKLCNFLDSQEGQSYYQAYKNNWLTLEEWQHRVWLAIHVGQANAVKMPRLVREFTVLESRQRDKLNPNLQLLFGDYLRFLAQKPEQSVVWYQPNLLQSPAAMRRYAELLKSSNCDLYKLSPLFCCEIIAFAGAYSHVGQLLPTEPERREQGFADLSVNSLDTVLKKTCPQAWAEKQGGFFDYFRLQEKPVDDFMKHWANLLDTPQAQAKFLEQLAEILKPEPIKSTEKADEPLHVLTNFAKALVNCQDKLKSFDRHRNSDLLDSLHQLCRNPVINLDWQLHLNMHHPNFSTLVDGVKLGDFPKTADVTSILSDAKQPFAALIILSQKVRENPHIGILLRLKYPQLADYLNLAKQVLEAKDTGLASCYGKLMQLLQAKPLPGLSMSQQLLCKGYQTTMPHLQHSHHMRNAVFKSLLAKLPSDNSQATGLVGQPGKAAKPKRFTMRQVTEKFFTTCNRQLAKRNGAGARLLGWINQVLPKLLRQDSLTHDLLSTDDKTELDKLLHHNVGGQISTRQQKQAESLRIIVASLFKKMPDAGLNRFSVDDFDLYMKLSIVRNQLPKRQQLILADWMNRALRNEFSEDFLFADKALSSSGSKSSLRSIAL